VDNVVQANILADYALDHSAITSDVEQSIPLYSAINQVYNVALGERTTLNELFNLIREDLYKIFRSSERIHAITKLPTYREFREGDVRHSQANISKAKRLLGYLPTHNIKQGIVLTIPWYIR
jgi:UDP-N-acetylglucosamine 4-epimerase